MAKLPSRALQNALRNDLMAISKDVSALSSWLDAYFQFEVTTAASSRKVQRRDLELFLSFMVRELKNDQVELWTPRLTRAFKSALQNILNEDGTRRYNDRTVNRVLAHLKTFAKWIHKHRPFPLGEPTAKVKLAPTANLLAIERALTETERRRLLDAADLLCEVGGRSKDRHRYRDTDKRPTRKGYRPWRNRAIIYTLIETGMRRQAITNIDVCDVDMKDRNIKTIEKGSVEHTYSISREGLRAVADYLEHERSSDSKQFKKSAALFLPAATNQNSSGRLSAAAINMIWNQVSKAAGVTGKTPHSARHAMGRHIIQKTGNVAAVQRQLGHKNATYSMQYARITNKELKEVLDDRE